MPKSAQSKFFPGKLLTMLGQVDALGLSHGASWVSEGRAFAIHDPEIFMNEIAPQFFDKQTHLRSFHRQLSIWGFTRLETGAVGRGVWFHKYFNRDKPELVKHIKRVPVKNPKPNASIPKNQLPDYSNYQLPSAISHESGKGPTKPPMLHQPHQLPGVVPPQPGQGAPMPPPGAPNGQYLPPMNRMPPGQAPPPGYAPGPYPPMPGMPMNANGMPTGYPNFLMPPPVAAPNAPGQPNVPNTGDVNDIASQLLACRQTTSPQTTQQGGSGSGNDRSNIDLNAALLAVIMDSRRREGPGGAPAPGANGAAPQQPNAAAPPNVNAAGGTGLSQELINALAQRNLYPPVAAQGGQPAPQMPPQQLPQGQVQPAPVQPQVPTAQAAQPAQPAPQAQPSPVQPGKVEI